MPPSPEGRYILCKKRAVEIICKPESEEACRTKGNISISREIKVDIEGLEQECNNQGQARIPKDITVHMVDQQTKGISDGQLLKKTE